MNHFGLCAASRSAPATLGLPVVPGSTAAGGCSRGRRADPPPFLPGSAARGTRPRGHREVSQEPQRPSSPLYDLSHPYDSPLSHRGPPAPARPPARPSSPSLSPLLHPRRHDPSSPHPSCPHHDHALPTTTIITPARPLLAAITLRPSLPHLAHPHFAPINSRKTTLAEPP